MRRIILITLAAIAGLVAVFLVVVALQPSEFHVMRSATIVASAPDVFGHVNNLHNWQAWSPWAKLDPDAKNSFEGPGEGEGAIFRWVGNDEVGEGSMTIIESRPYEQILMKLEFVKPFEDTADVDFTFQPQGDQTVVTWSMSGRNNFIAKAMCLFIDMDEMIGSRFDEGLASMKKVVEATPAEGTPVEATTDE
jgi:hypothetical protein